MPRNLGLNPVLRNAAKEPRYNHSPDGLVLDYFEGPDSISVIVDAPDDVLFDSLHEISQIGFDPYQTLAVFLVQGTIIPHKETSPVKVPALVSTTTLASAVPMY